MKSSSMADGIKLVLDSAQIRHVLHNNISLVSSEQKHNLILSSCNQNTFFYELMHIKHFNKK